MNADGSGLHLARSQCEETPRTRPALPRRKPTAAPPAQPAKRSANSPAATAERQAPRRSRQRGPAVESPATSPLDRIDQRRGGGVSSAPTWLVSMIVHMIAILIFAQLTFSLVDPNEGTFIDASPVSKFDEAPLEEMVIQEEPLELKEMTFQAPAPLGPAMDFSNLAAEVASAASTNVTVGEVQQTMIGEIGALFAEGGGGMADTTAGMGGAEFFGVKASGRIFTFVVDSSKSMNGGKFEAACRELFAAVSRLQPEQRFYVIFFDHDAYRMFDLKNPEPYPIPATSENIYRLGSWLPKVELELRTDAYESIKYAVEMLPDAIYILSDGKFTDQRKVDTFLRQHNIIDDVVDGRQPKVILHTIGFYDRAGEKNLSRLAQEYGGTYRFVPNPKEKRQKPKAGKK